MCVMTSQMDPKTYSHVGHTARKSPVAFQPPPPPPLCGTSAASPTSPSTMGSMNYSPRHSRKPSSLLSSRNIHIQRLLLNTTSPPHLPPVPVTLPPKRGKPLALLIPSVTSPSVSSDYVAQTPVRESMFPAEARAIHLPEVGASPRFLTYTRTLPESVEEKLRSPFKSGLGSLQGSLEGSLQSSHEDLSLSLAELHIHAADTDSLSAHTETYTHVDPDPVLTNTPPSAKTGKTTMGVPEELQEIGLTSAYPHGPANVLNSVIYLYSDPETSKLPVDVNDYDLVINVARECKDLSLDFDAQNGTRKYLRVPWSHTSTILKELPMITREIAAMDKPGKRILVHCQCGVLRSACVVVAYFMVKFSISVNEAYELLKSGTANQVEACTQQVKQAGNHVDACERICPNMNLIFELMDFGDRLEKAESQ